MSSFFFLPLQYSLIAIDWYGLFTILIPVHAFLLLPIVAVLGADTTRFLERAAKVQWGLMVCVYCVSHVPALLALDISGFEGRNMLLIVQASEVLQYVWGKLLGRRGERHSGGGGDVVDHAVLAASGGYDRAGDQPRRLLRRTGAVGDQPTYTRSRTAGTESDLEDRNANLWGCSMKR